MEHVDLSALHPQVENYLRASESLISAALESQKPFPNEQLLLAADYTDEVAKILALKLTNRAGQTGSMSQGSGSKELTNVTYTGVAYKCPTESR